ncbi:MAG: ATP-dependent DNA ligase [Acidimicrobiales bacterium]|jgi:ATP-dependent DNA ligase
MSVADLPVTPPVAPMLAKLERSLPVGDYFYEPKWDGFRGIVFRQGTDVEIGSRNELPLTRYFPELVADLRAALPDAAVVDGEVVVAGPGGLDFDALSQRVHPASSRVRMLAEKTPASFVAFDLLALGERDMRGEPFHERRRVLEDILGSPEPVGRSARVHLTPATRQRAVAEDWFRRFEGAGLDGVVAKPAELVYVPGKRAMVKVKHERTAEFVVGGFRWYRASSGAASGQEVGSLMLGLYDAAGRLAHVGVIGAFPAEQRRQLAEVLAPYRAPAAGAGAPGGDHPWAAWAPPAQLNGPAPAGARMPGARSRWNATKDLSFEPVRPELVVEAAYEHLQGDRLRHTAQFRRWRPDRDPLSCTYDQLEAAVPMLLAEVFGAGVVGPAAFGASARPDPGPRSR